MTKHLRKKTSGTAIDTIVATNELKCEKEQFSILAKVINNTTEYQKFSILIEETDFTSKYRVIVNLIKWYVNRSEGTELHRLTSGMVYEYNKETTLLTSTLEADVVNFINEVTTKENFAFFTDNKQRATLVTDIDNYITKNRKAAALLECTKDVTNSDTTIFDTINKFSYGTITVDDTVGNNIADALTTKEEFGSKIGFMNLPYITGVTNGGFGKGTVNLILAPPNVGKTALMVSMAADVTKQGYQALFVTMEMKTNDIILRLASSILQYDINSLKYMPPLDVGEATKRTLNKCGTDPTVMYSPPGICKPSYVERKIIEMSYNGRKPHIVFVDYIGIMDSNEKHTSSVNMYDKYKGIAEQLAVISKRQDVVIVTAGQVNKEAVRNQSIDLASAALSQGIVDTVDFAISITVTDQQRTAGEVGITVVKNRYGENTMSGFTARASFSTMTLASSQEFLVGTATHNLQDISSLVSGITAKPTKEQVDKLAFNLKDNVIVMSEVTCGVGTPINSDIKQRILDYHLRILGDNLVKVVRGNEATNLLVNGFRIRLQSACAKYKCVEDVKFYAKKLTREFLRKVAKEHVVTTTEAYKAAGRVYEPSDIIKRFIEDDAVETAAIEEVIVEKEIVQDITAVNKVECCAIEEGLVQNTIDVQPNDVNKLQSISAMVNGKGTESDYSNAVTEILVNAGYNNEYTITLANVFIKEIADKDTAAINELLSKFNYTIYTLWCLHRQNNKVYTIPSTVLASLLFSSEADVVAEVKKYVAVNEYVQFPARKEIYSKFVQYVTSKVEGNHNEEAKATIYNYCFYGVQHLVNQQTLIELDFYKSELNRIAKYIITLLNTKKDGKYINRFNFGFTEKDNSDVNKTAIRQCKAALYFVKYMYNIKVTSSGLFTGLTNQLERLYGVKVDSCGKIFAIKENSCLYNIAKVDVIYKDDVDAINYFAEIKRVGEEIKAKEDIVDLQKHADYFTEKLSNCKYIAVGKLPKVVQNNIGRLMLDVFANNTSNASIKTTLGILADKIIHVIAETFTITGEPKYDIIMQAYSNVPGLLNGMVDVEDGYSSVMKITSANVDTIAKDIAVDEGVQINGNVSDVVTSTLIDKSVHTNNKELFIQESIQYVSGRVAARTKAMHKIMRRDFGIIKEHIANTVRNSMVKIKDRREGINVRDLLVPQLINELENKYLHNVQQSTKEVDGLEFLLKSAAIAETVKMQEVERYNDEDNEFVQQSEQHDIGKFVTENIADKFVTVVMQKQIYYSFAPFWMYTFEQFGNMREHWERWMMCKYTKQELDCKG